MVELRINPYKDYSKDWYTNGWTKGELINYCIRGKCIQYHINEFIELHKLELTSGIQESFNLATVVYVRSNHEGHCITIMPMIKTTYGPFMIK